MQRRPVWIRLTFAAVAVLLVLGLVAGCSSSGGSDAAGSTDSGAAGDSGAATTTGPCADSKVTGDFGEPPKVEVATGGEAPAALVKKDIIVGDGAEAKLDGEATLNYALYLCSNGKLVQSSFDGGQPFQATLSQGQLIDGWIEGVPGMKVGGRRMLVIPPDLGYGAAGQPPDIPGDATLLFVVDLVSVP